MVMQGVSKKSRRLLSVAVAGVLVAVALPLGVANAALSSTSVQLSDARPSATSQYTLSASGFDTGASIGCIEVDLGSSSDGSGSVTGLSTGSSTMVSQSITATGTWAVDNTASSDHKLRMTNSTPVAPQSGTQTAVWGAVTNGSTADTGYYAKVTTYTTDACSTPVDTVTTQFIYTDGTTVSANVDSSLAFSVAGTSSGTSCNGASSNVTTTATTVPFGTVTTASNKVGVQELTASTNAGNGYTVAARYSGELASGANTIDDHSGTNASPTAFSSAGTAAFGYTTNDSSLGTGTANRFTSTPNVWAGFTTSNNEIAYNDEAIASQTTCVGQQVGVATTTPSGAYTTSVIYTATPVY